MFTPGLLSLKEREEVRKIKRKILKTYSFRETVGIVPESGVFRKFFFCFCARRDISSQEIFVMHFGVTEACKFTRVLDSSRKLFVGKKKKNESP